MLGLDSEFTNKNDINSFIIFDSKLSQSQLSEPLVYFSYFAHADKNSYTSMNLAGLYLTFIKFTKYFTQEFHCDYITTNLYESSILELGNNVWMAVQRNASHRSSNVNILSSSLRLCRDIYNLFFPPIQRDSSGYLDTNSRSSIQAAFSLIIHSVKWCDLDFCTLFHSFYQLHIDNRITRNFYPIIQTVVNSRTPIKYIILMYSRYVIFYTFPTNVAETLSYCLRTKFQYLYPRVLTKEDEKLYWTIGVYMSTLNNISSYSPPIFINGEPHPLVALRFKKFRFLMCLEPNCVPSFEILRTIPHLIRPLKKYVERMKIETKNGRKEFGTYIVIRNTTPEKFIDVSHERLADQLIPIVEELICQGQLFADYFSNKAEVCFPATAELKVLFRKCLSSEVGIICRCENKNCSKVFEIMKEMEVVENTKRIEVKLEE